MRIKYIKLLAGLLCVLIVLSGTVYAKEAVEGCNDEVSRVDNDIESMEMDILQEESNEGENEIIKIDESHFPDVVFREYVTEEFDLDKNSELSEDEINLVDAIQVRSKGISDLTGIEHFVKLKKLDCLDNKLQNLDITQNINLESVNCFGNQLSELDLTNNTKLYSLSCCNNPLIELDLSNNIRLAYLSCCYNRLTDLDVSRNTRLNYLSCIGNRLTNLDLRNNSSLRELRCGSNRLGNINFSSSDNLEILMCENNLISSLDLSYHIYLKELECTDNQMKSLDVSNNRILNVLRCSNNQIKELNISQNKELYALLCSNNQLTDLDISNNLNLKLLLCSNNQLSILQLNNMNLSVVDCQNNHLSEVSTAECKLQDGYGIYMDGELYNDYDNAFSLQSVNATAYRQNGQWVIDLSKKISKDALKKVSVKDGVFDSSTGIWALPERMYRTHTYTILAGKKINRSEIEEDIYVDVMVDVDYNIGNSSIVVETEQEVELDISEIDTNSICKKFEIDPETSATKIFFKQTEVNPEDWYVLEERIEADGNTAMNAYGVNMNLYVNDIEKGQIKDEFGRLTLDFYVGTENKGKEAVVYQLYGDEVKSYKNLIVDENGKVSVSVTKLSTFAVALQEIRIGDIDGNGEVNLVDLMMCLNHVSKKKLLEGNALIAADIDGENGVNLVDLMRILNYVSKKSTEM